MSFAAPPLLGLASCLALSLSTPLSAAAQADPPDGGADSALPATESPDTATPEDGRPETVSPDTAAPEEARPERARPSALSPADAAQLSDELPSSDDAPQGRDEPESRRSRRLRLSAEHFDVSVRQLRRGRAIAATSVAFLYAGLWTYNYFAWWHGTPTTPFQTEWDGYFGVDTYGGGADKMGHMYMNLLLSRATTGILRYGRFETVPASIAGATLSWLSYLLVELRDGAHEFEFSFGDLLANSLGVGLGLLFTHVPEVDRYVSLRMMYWPSKDFRRNPSLNFNEDYSGQTFLLAFHPAAFGDRVGFFRYIDFVVGFNARNYLPTPPRDSGRPERQHLYFGFALNLQEVLNRGLFNRPRAEDNRAQEAARGFFADWAAEHIQVPFTAVPLIQMQRTNHN
ncbi:MAG: DUF2279 domain-containing protein [Polyangiales bacterium]|nr:DUF2279 domain-containing protein [Sandaracinaceae bacterium]